MKFPSTVLRTWSMALLLPWLAACAAIAPGMHMEEKYDTPAEGPQVVPVVKTITPQLVQSERQMYQQQALSDISGLVGQPSSYKIQPGDILSIVVWNHPELAAAVMSMPATGIIGIDTAGITSLPAGFVVDQDGLVQFPFAGSLKIAGLTVEEARRELSGRLARYLKNPDVTLRVQAYRGSRVYVDGEVKTPGLQAMNDVPMNLMEALNRSGGLLPTADQGRISVVRAGKTYSIDLPQLLKRGVDPNTIMLENGDVVRVATRDAGKVYVLGEVTTPIPVQMINGSLTLSAALGEAGGLSVLSASGRQVYVIRNGASMEPTVYHLDARSPTAYALAENFELQRKDVVYVDAHPLATWNRVISLILPGALTSPIQTVVLRNR